MHSENTKNKVKNHKNSNIYLSAKLYQFFKNFEDDNIQNNFAKKTISDKSDYTFFSDKKIDKKANDLIDRTCTQQVKMVRKKSERSIQHENAKRRRKHQLSIDVSNRKRRI